MYLDIDEYLPPVTLEWCRNTLERLGYANGIVNGRDVDAAGSKLHLQAYLSLREAIIEHVLLEHQPQLAETDKPYHARNWRPTTPVERELNAGSVDIVEPRGGDPWINDWADGVAGV